MWKILQMQIACMQNKFAKTLKLKKLGEYHDFYLKSGTILLADVSKNFKK